MKKQIKNINRKLGFDASRLSTSESNIEILDFLSGQGYFCNYNASEKQAYIQNFFDLYNTTDPRIKRNFKSMLSSNIFEDQNIIKYSGTSKNSIERSFIYFAPIAMILSFLAIYFIDDILIAMGSTFTKSNVSHILDFIALAGTAVAMFDIYFDAAKLKTIDQKIESAINSYEKSWVNSIKVSMLIQNRAMDIVIAPIWTLLFILFGLKFIEFSHKNLVLYSSVALLPLAIDRIARPTSVKLFAIHLTIFAATVHLISSQGWLSELNDRFLPYFVFIAIYYILIVQIQNSYTFFAPQRRKALYYAYLTASAPNILVRALYKALPFVACIPLHKIIQISIALKPTSTIRALGGTILLVSMTLKLIIF